MLSVNCLDDEIQLVMCPDQSLSWRGNQYLFLFITAWLLGFAMLLLVFGSWIILPFVGLELLALGSALYYVSWKLSHRQVLEIAGDCVTFTTGRLQPEHSHSFLRSELVIHVTPPDHPWGTPVIELRGKGGTTVRVGEFLNREDCQKLLLQLRMAHLTPRRGLGVIHMAF